MTLDLLRPQVFNGVVQKFTTSQTKVMLNSITKTPWPYPTAEWDVLRGSMAIARYNVPGGEANIVDRLGRSHQNVAFATLREKKIFPTVLMRYLRTPGSVSEVNAAQLIVRELRDLNERFDNRVELDIWQALTGTLPISDAELGSIGNVDYGFLPSHKPTTAHNWSTATPAQIVADVKAWKKLILRDGQVKPTDAWTSTDVLDYVFQAFATRGDSGTNFVGAALLSDRMKDQYFAEGTLPGFMGLNWNINENTYDPNGTAYAGNPITPSVNNGATPFLNYNSLIIGNFTDNRPLELFEGLITDERAPVNYTGRFAKNWQDEDPSELQYLMAYSYLPVISRPEQFVSVLNVTLGS